MSDNIVTTKPSPKLGQILVKCGMISAEYLEEALERQAQMGPHQRLGEVLIAMGRLGHTSLGWALAYQRRLEMNMAPS